MTSAEAVRQWARGMYPTEAGVELLARAGLLYDRAPWITGGYVDVDVLLAETGALSGGKQRLVRIAAALLGEHPVDLYEDVPGLDREHLALVLAAIAHAGGSHEHSGLDVDGEGNVKGFKRLSTLYAWPQEAETP